MAEWEAESFEPGSLPGVTDGPGGGVDFIPVVAPRDKWEGEDEDDEVKDNWDDEVDEDEGNPTTNTGTKPKKKSLAERIKEKEEKRREELLEKKLNEQPATEEEVLADKLRLQKLQEESDLEIAKEAFGVSNLSVSTIESIFPSTATEFEEFSKKLTEKITQFEKSHNYVTFLENFFRDLCAGLNIDDVKALGSTLNVLANEKSKAEKAVKGKKKSKKAVVAGAGKAGKRDDLDDLETLRDDFDDFI